VTVSQNQIYFYGSANMPEDESSTVGGAVTMSTLVFFSDISPNGLMDYVSSSASDTAAVLTVTGLDATGVSQAEAKTLNGTTLVNGSQTFERLMKGVATGTTAVGDIAAISHTKIISAHTAQSGGNTSGQVEPFIQLAAADGASVAVGQIIRITNNSPAGVNFQLRRIVRISGDFAYVNRDWGTAPTSASTYDVHEGMLFDLSPNQVTTIRRVFYNIAADVPGGSSRTFYEKVFCVNNNTATALTQAVISKQSDPTGGTLNFGVCKALNDTATAANRQTLPANGDSSAITFTSGAAPQSQNVPSQQNLPSGNAPNAAGAEGLWLQYVIPAGTAPAKTSFTLRGAGNSV